MRVMRRLNNKNSDRLSVRDLEDGTVFVDENGFLMAKVSYCSGYEPKTYVLAFDLMELFDDIDKYKVCQIVDASLLVE